MAGVDIPKALEIASRIYERHVLLTKFFVNLGVDEETAAKDACMVEHDLSETTFEALCRHAEKYSAEPINKKTD